MIVVIPNKKFRTLKLQSILTKARSLILLLLLPGYFLNAQKELKPQEISRYIPDNIPINNQTWNICRSPKNGFVYFANSEGLGEYNGISMKMYPLPFSQSIRSVYVSGEGRIYTGSFEEFGFWKDTTGGDLIYKSLSKDIHIEKNDEIWKIYESAGKIYFQSFTTIYRYDQKTVKEIKAPFTMLFLFNTGGKFVCQVLGTGLYWFDGDKFEFIKGSELFKTAKVHSVFGTSGDQLWVCTASNGIYRYEGTGFRYFKSEISTFLAYHTCNAGLSLSDSIFAFGTISNGIALSDSKGRILNTFNYSNGLKNNTVLSLYRDNSNGIWAGLDEGAVYINLNSPRTTYANLSGNLGTIYTLLRDSDRLYLGTNHGLFKANIKKSDENYSFTDLSLIPYTQEQVWTLGKFDNQIICGHNDGTFLLEGDRFRPISGVTGGWSIRKYNDLLIEGTYTGIILFGKDSRGRWTFRNKLAGFDEPSRHIEIDYLGYIWAFHPQKGFYRLEPDETLDSIVRIQYYNSVTSKPESVDIYKINNQIVFTTSDSIYTFDYDRRVIIPFTRLNNSLGEYRRSIQIIPDSGTRYWFIMGNRVAVFNISKDFKAVKELEINHKVSYLPERQIQIVRLSNKTVLIPGRQAFTTYNLSMIKEAGYSPGPVITKVSFHGKRRTLETGNDTINRVRVPYYLNNLNLSFSDPSDFESEAKTFDYHIDGLDDEWHSTVTDNISYLNLPSGSYKLQVRSGLNGRSDYAMFTIRRPWYISALAFVVYFVIIAGLISWILLSFRRRMDRQRKLLEFEVSYSKLVSELDFKSYELMLSTRYLIQKDEILSKLSEQINSLKEQSSRFPVKFIREMDRIISRGHSQAEEWSNALNSLKLSQQGFFRKLVEKHPGLTPNDLRLCSYLRMNLTTKEIAKLLKISDRAVEISRYRLRRKMNLGHDVSLTEYLIKAMD